jgi:serine/threonine-protein kinase
MMAHIADPIPRPSSSRPGLAPELDDLVVAALAKDPRERTPSAEAFLRSLVLARAKTRDPVRILIADDDEDFRAVFGEILSHEFPDAVVESVPNGEAVIEAFDRQCPSVAIVDLDMPRIGGTELTEILRARRASQNVPIVVLTGSGGPAEWRRLAALGADGFLVKPVNVKDVATLLRRVVSERARSSPTPVPELPRESHVETKPAARTALPRTVRERAD